MTLDAYLLYLVDDIRGGGDIQYMCISQKEEKKKKTKMYFLKNPSSLTFHAKDAAGKYPHLLPFANLLLPSALKVPVNIYLLNKV